MEKIILKKVIGVETPFSHIGVPIDVYKSKNYLAVSSYLGSAGWASRSLNSGNLFSNRVSLIDLNDMSLISVTPQIKHSINDIAFHSSEPIVAIATGDYDGGYIFSGELIIWNWETHVLINILRESVTVTKVRFSTDEKSVEIITTVPNEGNFERDVFFDRYYHKDIPITGQECEFLFEEIVKEESLGFTDLADDSRVDLLYEVSSKYELRSHSRDVKWLGKDSFCNITNEKLLEIWNISGERLLECSDDSGIATELLVLGEKIIINQELYRENQSYHSKSRLLQLDTSGKQTVLKEFDYSISISSCSSDSILVRDTKNSSREKSQDLIFKDGHFGEPLDLGHYDLFNHHLRINGEDRFYFLQGDPKNQHRNKVLCTLDDNSQTTTSLWPVEWDTKRNAQLMEGTACIMDGIFVSSFIIHTGNPYVKKGFIALRHLSNGKIISYIETNAQASVLTPIKGKGVVFYALVNGQIGLIPINSNNGLFKPKKKVHAQRLIIEEVPNCIISADWNGENLLAGTVDGRILILEIKV